MYDHNTLSQDQLAERICRLDYELENWTLTDSERVRRRMEIKACHREIESHAIGDTDDVHIALRQIDGVWHRYPSYMNDHDFQRNVQDNLAEYEIGGLSGWRFSHVRKDEWLDKGIKYDVLMEHPVVNGDVEYDLVQDILRLRPNHQPCAYCDTHMDAPPRGELCTGYIPGHTLGYGERGRVWNGYLCEQCAEEVQPLKWK